MLQSALAIREEKQFVFQDRAANVGAFLVTLVGGRELRSRCSVHRRRQRSAAGSVVAEQAECFAVERVGARLGGYVDRTGRSEIVGEIQARLRQREFLNRAGRNVFRGGADRLIADIDAVNADAGGTAKPSAERD